MIQCDFFFWFAGRCGFNLDTQSTYAGLWI
jgi:hypothetical protein